MRSTRASLLASISEVIGHEKYPCDILVCDRLAEWSEPQWPANAPLCQPCTKYSTVRLGHFWHIRRNEPRRFRHGKGNRKIGSFHAKRLQEKQRMVSTRGNLCCRTYPNTADEGTSCGLNGKDEDNSCEVRRNA